MGVERSGTPITSADLLESCVVRDKYEESSYYEKPAPDEEGNCIKKFVLPVINLAL